MEIEFDKYARRGAGYHWDENSGDPRRMNLFVKTRYDMCIKLLSEHLGGLAGKSILDFGCGDGVLAYQLFKSGAKAQGIDSSPLAIDFARSKHAALRSEAAFYCGSCYATPFAGESFDAAVSTDVIEHVQDVAAFCLELRRVVRVGGVVVISTPVRLTETPMDKNHVQEWFPHEFRTLLSKYFEIVDVRLSHPVFWFELYFSSTLMQKTMNIIFFLANPFSKEISRWKFPTLQFVICKVPNKAKRAGV